MGLSPKQARVSLDAELWRMANDSYGHDARLTVCFHKALANNRCFRPPTRIISSLYTKWRSTTCAGDNTEKLQPFAQLVVSAAAWFEAELKTAAHATDLTADDQGNDRDDGTADNIHA